MKKLYHHLLKKKIMIGKYVRHFFSSNSFIILFCLKIHIEEITNETWRLNGLLPPRPVYPLEEY
jgi:hypothetical protein